MARRDTTEVTSAGPWLTPWPETGLEVVNGCPACGSESHAPSHTDLVDSSFRSAPGRWALRRCLRCGSCYLTPRPTPDALPLAYTRYYTHNEPPSPDRRKPWHRLRDWVANSYINARFGAHLVPAAAWASAFAWLLPFHRGYWAREYRHLPKPRPGAAELLDVGCGGGDFLLLARDCGWNVYGLEVDAVAVARARKHGLLVQAGELQSMTGMEARFDVITLSHVIEHVHEPLSMLRHCHRLLKPGGLLWLETPNVESGGHRRFGPHWRGLEAPRHLTIFSWRGLCAALETAGFIDIRRQAVPSSRRATFAESAAMAAGGPADRRLPLPPLTAVEAYAGHLTERIGLAEPEFITLTAHRPPTNTHG